MQAQLKGRITPDKQKRVLRRFSLSTEEMLLVII